MKTIIICGGGTLGHIMPGIAFSKILKQENTKIVFITGVKDKRFDEFINSGKIDEIYYYDVCGLSRKNPFKNILGFFTNYESFFKIKQLFKEEKPSLVIGMGGYISAIVLKAASSLSIKTILHEQNAVMGLANKMCLKSVNKVLLTFPIDNIPNSIVIGNPRLNEASKKTLNKISNHITVLSGSLGSEVINNIIVDFLKTSLSTKYFTTLITGKRYYEEVVKNLGTNKNKHFEVMSLSRSILDIMASSSLIISRSGATTIFEIIGLNIPSILIPSPNVVNNHQYYNALYLHNKQASVLLEEKDLNIDSLNKNIEYCINNVVIKDNLKKIKEDYLKVSWEGVIEDV